MLAILLPKALTYFAAAVLAFPFGSETEDSNNNIPRTTCTEPCCITAPIGGCDLIAAMNGYCCEPLAEDKFVLDDPHGSDARIFPQGRPLGSNFTFTMPWAETVFAKTYNESFSNPGYLAGQAVKYGHNADAYYLAAMKFKRPILVYIPADFHVSDEGAKVQIIMDGEWFCNPAFLPNFANALENSIAAQELPMLVLVCVASGTAMDNKKVLPAVEMNGKTRSTYPGSDDPGNLLRDFEYMTMSDRNAKFLVEEVLPAVETNPEIQTAYPGFKFSANRKDRATLGCSGSGAASIIASWFAPQYFHRALGFSPTMVQVLSTPCTREMDASQCDSATPDTLKDGYPRGAWDWHSDQDLIGSSVNKDIRIYHQAAQNDILGCSVYLAKRAITNCTKQFSKSGNEGYFNIRLANNRSAARLSQKNYKTRFVYSLNQSHCTVLLDPSNGGKMKSTVFDGIVWVWQDVDYETIVS